MQSAVQSCVGTAALEPVTQKKSDKESWLCAEDCSKCARADSVKRRLHKLMSIIDIIDSSHQLCFKAFELPFGFNDIFFYLIFTHIKSYFFLVLPCFKQSELIINCEVKGQRPTA